MDAEAKSSRPKVAVVGLGISGIAAVKNFLEEGFDVTGFDRNDYIGGLWKYTTNVNQTSVLQSTRTNGSRFRHTFSDYQFPLDWPDFPTGEQIDAYIQNYVDHFRLRQHCRLNTAIERVGNSKDGKHWVLTSSKDGKVEDESFDKVYMTLGANGKAYKPFISGEEKYTGRILHSQAYKSPKDFTGQRVLVVGISNTGADTAVDLCGKAEKIWASHQLGAYMGPRYNKAGKPQDQIATRRVAKLMAMGAKMAPTWSFVLAAKTLTSKMKGTYPVLRPEWRLLPAPPVPNSTPVINDKFVDFLEASEITSVHGIRRFNGAKAVELADGTILEADAVIFCTGYHFPFDVLVEGNPTDISAPEWNESRNANGMRYARLYKGIISPRYPESLAFYGHYRGPTFSGFTNGDVVSQAVAQVWKGAYLLPSKSEIESWCDGQYQYDLKMLSNHRVSKPALPPGEVEQWLNEVAGNGMIENLGWTWKGWKFWWSDRQLYKLIMDGFDTAYVYRLFDGRRKKWDGARDAILRTNGKLKE